jgi:hypothetical protein
MFSILLCGSDPRLPDFDDCWTGVDYDNEADALADFHAPDPIDAIAERMGNPVTAGMPNGFRTFYADVVFLELDGVAKEGEDNPVRQLREPKRSRVDHEWRNEFAMQAGMMGGVDAYNDALG